MTMWKQVRRGSVIALAISVIAVLAFAWGNVNPDGAQAAADGPAMSLSAPGTVFMGVTFQVTVSASPSPDVEIASFGSEVLFRDLDGVLTDGLKWQQRENCADEVVPESQTGLPLSLCQAGLSTLLEGARHAVITNIGIPPLDPFDVAPGSTTPLVELDFVCNTPGSYTLTLTATPDSPDGAVFANLAATEIPVKTVEGSFDADGDGTAETHQVADSLTIECTDEPPPTDVPPEPTDVPPEPTDAPPEPTADVEPTVGGPVTGVAGGTGDSGTNAGIWVLIGTLLAASVAGMTVFGWKRTRVR